MALNAELYMKDYLGTPEPIKSLGDFTISVKLHREVTAHLSVHVAADASQEVAEPVPAPAVAD